MSAVAPAEARSAPRRSGTGGAGLPRPGLVAGVGLGAAVLWLSLLVLLPLAAVLVRATGSGWGGFWASVTAPPARAALVLTVSSAAAVALVNAVVGTLVAWVLVRDRFRGKRLVDTVIDVPFALPTIVISLVMLTLYGPASPIGVDLLGTRVGVVLALLFVTLPFVVRSVQPVLESLDPGVEQAAASLGAGRAVTFRRIVLPALIPAILSGAALAFARAMGEYGSVLLISGGLARTRVSSMYAFQQIENYDYTGAAATATVLLAVSIVVLAVLDGVQHRRARHG